VTTILADAGDELRIIDEERQAWLRRVLVAFGADEVIIAENTLEAKRHVSQLGLDIEGHPDGSIDIARLEISVVVGKGGEEIPIETGRKLVAQWLPPKLVRVRDRPRDHYRITLREWALPFQME
jgi:hypothetical protein